MSEQLDIFGAKQARDEALAHVGRYSYSDEAVTCIRKVFSFGAVVTGEDIRLSVQKEIGAPHHHNAWGAIITKAIRAGVIYPTGRYVHMKTKKSHARRTPEYRVGR